MKAFSCGNVYLSAMIRRLGWKKIIALLILLLQAIALFVPTAVQKVDPPTSFAAHELKRWIDDVVEFWLDLFGPEREPDSSQVEV